MTSFQERVESARAGTNPTVVCRVASGWVALCDMQYLRGYAILLADPLVASLNDLGQERRRAYLEDMASVGDALLEVTGACRINYAIAGNSDPFLHAHIIPRYSDEPEQYRRSHPWSYPDESMQATKFDAARDRALMQQLAGAILRRSGKR